MTSIANARNNTFICPTNDGPLKFDETGNTLLNNQYLKHEEYTVPEYNALNKELTHFIDCIINNNQPITDGKSAMQALKLALDIESMF